MRALLALALLGAACSENIELLPARDLGASGGDGGSTTVPTPGGDQCAAATAASLHRFALCACTPVTTSQRLASVVFDSAGAATGHTGAAIGINGDFSDDKPFMLEGALYSSGTIHANGGGSTTETLRANAGLAAGNATNVSGDAFVGGDVSGSIVIGGSLHVPATANVGSGVQSGAIVREPVSVTAPCDCETAAAVDVAGAIAAARGSNDNALAGLATSPLTSNVSLPGGRFYVTGLSTVSDDIVAIAVHGRAALYVDGDVTLKEELAVELDAGAELDVFVGGALSTHSNRTFGSTTAPARVRVWTKASAITLDGTPTIGAVVTAPNAAVDAPGGIVLYGSLLTQTFTTENDATVHYDQAILSSGTECGGSPLPAVR